MVAGEFGEAVGEAQDALDDSEQSHIDFDSIGGELQRGEQAITARCNVVTRCEQQCFTIGHGAKIGANSVVITDVPANSTVVGNPGHPVRVEGRRPEGPDADWIHLPDPIAEAIQGLASRIGALERTVAELSEDSPEPIAEVRPLRTVKGPNPAGG